MNMSPITIILRFLRLEAASGVILFLMALSAVIVVNSPWVSFYQSFLNLPFSMHLGLLSFSKPLIFIVNEGLMALFFLLVGLELKREFLEGELSGIKKVLLPGCAALGGMLVPALVYLFFNFHSETTLRGWAIPVATDIAFALGALSLFGRRIPLGLRLFLMALAIFDDIGAIVIIAFFYSHDISLFYMLFSLFVILLLWMMNHLLNIRKIFPYLLLGIILWVCVLHSGVHASITGVIISLMVPLHSKSEERRSPLHTLEDALHPWVAYFVLPLFAFVNAGLSFEGLSFQSLLEPIVLGTIAGLFLGKQLGVFAVVWIMIRLGFAKLPARATWWQMYGVSLLCGIGFTMSLFLGTLAFQGEYESHMSEVRLGVLCGSLLSGLTGIVLLSYKTRRPNLNKK